MRQRTFYVYILASDSRVLYTGVTSDLQRRTWEHRNGVVEGFTRRYHIHHLVHYEATTDVHAALARERQIKAWNRSKRVRLIEQHNPGWRDLAAAWFDPR